MPYVLLGRECNLSLAFGVVVVYDLVMSPEPFILKCRSLKRAKSVYLEVVDRSVRLAWLNDDESGFMKRADVLGLGITYDMLLEALSEAKGTTSTDGRYPINEEIKRQLRKLLNVK
jgi:hypothetical protein